MPSVQAIASSLQHSPNLMYVQYGCGHHAPSEWMNFDASPTLRWERIPVLGRYTKNAGYFPANVRSGNIVKGLPVPDNHCKGAYASHVLEHLSLDDFYAALRNTKKMLRSGGLFRLVVPDLEQAARDYIQKLECGDTTANSHFLRSTCLGVSSRRAGLASALYDAIRTSAHLWMWDRLSLEEALIHHGFSGVRRCEFGDCEDPMFQLVEERSRFEGAIAMEARG